MAHEKINLYVVIPKSTLHGQTNGSHIIDSSCLVLAARVQLDDFQKTKNHPKNKQNTMSFLLFARQFFQTF